MVHASTLHRQSQDLSNIDCSFFLTLFRSWSLSVYRFVGDGYSEMDDRFSKYEAETQDVGNPAFDGRNIRLFKK